MKVGNGRDMPGHNTTNGQGASMKEEIQKVALVAGAARGIGLATAKRFLAEGWRVVLLDIDDETLKCSSAIFDSDMILPICCDVADFSGVAKALGAVARKFGRLDVLVNNAG